MLTIKNEENIKKSYRCERIRVLKNMHLNLFSVIRLGRCALKSNQCLHEMHLKALFAFEAYIYQRNITLVHDESVERTNWW